MQIRSTAVSQNFRIDAVEMGHQNYHTYRAAYPQRTFHLLPFSHSGDDVRPLTPFQMELLPTEQESYIEGVYGGGGHWDDASPVSFYSRGGFVRIDVCLDVTANETTTKTIKVVSPHLHGIAGNVFSAGVVSGSKYLQHLTILGWLPPGLHSFYLWEYGGTGTPSTIYAHWFFTHYGSDIPENLSLGRNHPLLATAGQHKF
jgi:hypothetical protein